MLAQCPLMSLCPLTTTDHINVVLDVYSNSFPDSTPPLGHRWLWVARSQLALVGAVAVWWVQHPPQPTATLPPTATNGPPEVCYLGQDLQELYRQQKGSHSNRFQTHFQACSKCSPMSCTCKMPHPMNWGKICELCVCAQLLCSSHTDRR